jgi:hypothetical protein
MKAPLTIKNQVNLNQTQNASAALKLINSQTAQ